ncbi:hypothetical protein CLAIMM_10310 [Cladophialophora immunda]|nr:hypothetical protein CLAIMM_10310 [Cladophialophora immunda]
MFTSSNHARRCLNSATNCLTFPDPVDNAPAKTAFLAARNLVACRAATTVRAKLLPTCQGWDCRSTCQARSQRRFSISRVTTYRVKKYDLLMTPASNHGPMSSRPPTFAFRRVSNHPKEATYVLGTSYNNVFS